MGSVEKGKGRKLQLASKTAAAELVPPTNFREVEGNRIFRSAFPEPCNFRFLQSLKLRSVIYLCAGRYRKENLQFLQSNNIKLFQFGIDGKDEETMAIPSNTITEALKVLIDERNQPVLIHCKAGMHRTGCLVGALRKLQNWCLGSLLEEYKKAAGERSRPIDLIFLEEYDVSCLKHCSKASFDSTGWRCCRKGRLLTEKNV